MMRALTRAVDGSVSAWRVCASQQRRASWSRCWSSLGTLDRVTGRRGFSTADEASPLAFEMIEPLPEPPARRKLPWRPRPARPDGLRSQLAHLRPRSPAASPTRAPHGASRSSTTSTTDAPTPSSDTAPRETHQFPSVPTIRARSTSPRTPSSAPRDTYDASRGSPNPPTPETRFPPPPSSATPSGVRSPSAPSLASSRAPRRRIQSRGRRRVRNLNRPVLVRSGGRSTPRRRRWRRIRIRTACVACWTPSRGFRVDSNPAKRSPPR